MKEFLPVGCVIMASGLSRRFGSNKLLAPFCGEPMLCRAFAATDTPKLSARIVVTRSDEVAQLCRSRNVPVLLHDLPGRNDTVRLGLSALLEQVPDLDGVFCGNDQMAIGALKVLKEYGKRMPEDVKLMGYDDVFLASVVEPSLSTIHIRKKHAGIEAAKILFQRIEEQDEKFHDAIGVRMTARLVVRKSTVKDAPEDWNLIDW